MSISFKENMTSKTARKLQSMFEVQAIDQRTALLKNMARQLTQQEMKELANTEKQPVALEMNKIGDRKEVSGRVYKLNEKGWLRLPIGTKL